MGDEEEYKFVLEPILGPQRVIIAILFMVVFVVGVFGNSLTMIAVIVSRKLQTATNVFVINLAIADLLTCLTLPWNIAAMLGGESVPNPSHFSCVAAAGVLLVCLVASVYTLASIALGRYILITRMALFKKVHRPIVLVPWVMAIWLVAFCVMVVPALAGVGAIGYNPKYKTCSDISAEYLPYKNSTQTYDIIQAAGGFPIPLLVITFCYINILIFVRRNARNLNQWKNDRNSSMIASNVTLTSEADAENGNSTLPMEKTQSPASKPAASIRVKEKKKKASKISSQEIRVTKNLFIVFCAFLVCLLPYIVCLVYDDSDPVIPWAAAVLFFNSCLNPIIYATRFPNFKAIFKIILRCQWDKIPEPSRILTRFR